jgi:Type IX secretion system protein PorV
VEQKVMKKKFILSLMVVALAPLLLMGQSNDVSKVGTAAATFLEIPVGPTAIGMGGAFVSVANDYSSLYWNAAGIATIPQGQFGVSHTDWIADTRFDFAGLVLPVGSFGTLGFAVTSLSMGDMKVRTVDQPEGTGEYFSAGDLAIGVSYARSLTDRFAVGFTTKYIQESIWHESAGAFAVDAGTIFKTDLFGGMTIGAALSNFGTTMQMAGRDAREFISVDPTQLGTNSQIPSDIEFDSWSLPLLFQIGVSTDIVKSDDYRWTIAMDALHPSDNYESANIGSEMAFRDFIFIRGGYQSLFLSQSEGGVSFGVGINSSEFTSSSLVRFDYAFQNMGRLENVHVFSLALKF